MPTKSNRLNNTAARERGAYWLLACILWFLGFSVSYVYTNPPLEAPDEPGHLDYANFVATHGTLPNQLDPSIDKRAEQGHHFPLYYIAAAGVIRLVERDDQIRLAEMENPEHLMNGGSKPDVPKYQHGAEGDLSSFHGLRMLSVAFGALTVLFVGLAARSVMPKGPWILAPILVATLPQFQFISAAVSNDSLAAMTAALATWALLSANSHRHTRTYVWAGIAVAAAIWAKKSNLVFVPIALALPLLDRASLKLSAARLASITIPMLLIAGPLFVRQYVLYGDFLGNGMERETLGTLVDPKAITDPYFFTTFPKVTARSLVAHFGWMNVAVSTLAILAYWLVMGGMLILSSLSAFDKERRSVTVLLWAVVLLTLAGLAFYNLTYTQAQGRLLFPALTGIAVLVAVGCDRLKSSSASIWTAAAVWSAVDIVALLRNLRFYS